MANEKIPAEVKKQMMAVLQNFVELGVIGRACDMAGVERKRHPEWLEKYPLYKERFEEVRERFIDGLESVAIERAKDKSDSLLMMMLKAHRSEVYGDRSEIKHSGIGAVQLIFSEGMLNDDEKKILKGEKNEE